MSRFQRMLDRHADLRDSEKQLEIKEAFDILLRYCPDITRVPLIAGNEVRSMIQYLDGVVSETVRNLVEVQTAIDQFDTNRGEEAEPAAYPVCDDDDELVREEDDDSSDGDGGKGP